MLDRLQPLIAPPSCDIPDRIPRARTLTIILLIALGVSIVSGFVVVMVSPFPTKTLEVFIIFEMILLIALIFARREMVRQGMISTTC